jgi:hypothetical protein
MMNAKVRIAVACVLGAIGLTCAASAQSPAAPMPAAQRSITIYPVLLAGHPSQDVAEVVALMLENAGLTEIEVSAKPFTGNPDAEEGPAAQFGAMIGGAGLETDTALLAAFEGSPAEGVDAVRSVLVDRNGAVLWEDVQTPDDKAFKEVKPSNPMSCCVLLVTRLKDPLAYTEDPFQPATGDGPWARHWEAKSERPDRKELNAMRDRLAAMRAREGTPTVLVYPARVGDDYCAQSARTLAEQINARGAMKATPVEQPIAFKATPSSNEQKVLWTGARSVKDLVKNARPDADYVLVADYMIGQHEAHAVHWYLLEADGDWVVVDFQNSHHRDFKTAHPKTRDDCCRLVITRMAKTMS